MNESVCEERLARAAELLEQFLPLVSEWELIDPYNVLIKDAQALLKEIKP